MPGHPEISVIGDIANLEGPDGKPLPGLATVAIQQARHVAKAIRHGQPGATKPFKYLDKGALAVIGRGKAICEVRGLKLSGRLGARHLPRRAPLLPRRRRAGASSCSSTGSPRGSATAGTG